MPMTSSPERESTLFALARKKPSAERLLFRPAVCGDDQARCQRLAALPAKSTEPARRRVGVNVIKLWRDAKQAVARFEAERQAMALMDHPPIAKATEGWLPLEQSLFTTVIPHL